MENQEFIEVYEKVLDRTANIKKKTDEIRNKISETSRLVDESARVIRLVTLDITPSERFVSKEIDVIEPEKMHTQCREIETDNYSYQDVIQHERLVTNHKGFGSLREVIAPQGYKYSWSQTYASDINYKTMLGLISNQGKMMSLLREFLGANKKKASQRVMDLIGIQQEAKELLEMGELFHRDNIRIDLDEPVNLKIISLDHNSEIDKKDMLITSIRVENYKGILLLGDETDYFLDETELSHYPMFVQIIGALETTFNNMNAKLETYNAKVLEINSRILSKLQEFTLMEQLDKERVANAGSIYW